MERSVWFDGKKNYIRVGTVFLHFIRRVIGMEKKIVICCDMLEEPLAKKIAKYVQQVFMDFEVTHRVCSDQNLGDRGWEIFFENTHFIFILCSPYSIGQQGINFISGIAALYIAKTEKNKKTGRKFPRMIPLCHSGQKAKDLPHYLFSRQALEIEHKNFLSRLFLVIDKRKKYDSVVELAEHEIGEIYQTKSDVNTNLSEVKILKKLNLERSGNLISASDISEDQMETDENLHAFLSKKTNKVSQIIVSMGVQYCLFDGEKIFVGLRMAADVDPQFLSYCKPLGIFDPGYKQREIWPKQKQDLNDIFCKSSEVFNYLTEESTEIYPVMKKRALAMGIQLWHIKGLENNLKPIVATMFVNTTEADPKLEIGVWKFCMIEKDGTIVPQGTSPATISPLLKNNYWIWARDGEIAFWSYPEVKSISRYIHPQSNQGHKTFLATYDFSTLYGRPEKYTPFAADDVVGVESVVKEQFSASARALLSIF